MATLASVILRDIAANRPAAGIAGRLFFDTTNVKMQRDNGSSWDDVAEGGVTNPMTTTGDIIVGGASGTPARLAIGATGRLLGGGSTPAWVLPPGYEWDYVERTTDVSITATTDGTANTILTGNSVTFDGAAVYVEVYTPRLQAPNSASAFVYVSLYEDSTLKGYMMVTRFGSASANNWAPGFGRRKLTPSAAAHVYTAKGVVSAGTGVFGAGAGGSDYLPGYIRVVKA